MGHKIRFDPREFILLAIMILILPVNWILCAFAAAAFHELCHYAAVILCGGRIESLKIGVSGMIMEAAPMDKFKETMCAAAGPMGSLLLLCFARWIPCIAVCGGIQGIFNLLPVYPLDGGRILKNIASKKLCRIAEYSVLAVMLFGAIIVLPYGVAPLFATLFFCIRSMEIKIPCKEHKKRVQ